MNHPTVLTEISKWHRIAGWGVHLFTACGAIFGLLALLAIYHGQWINAFWLMLIAIIIDSSDGMLARWIKIKLVVPEINGELLDNIVDYLNYTIVPVFFLLVTHLLPDEWRLPCVIIVTLSSTYQFTQVDAKTSDHFFKCFPSYWNIVVFYLFFWQMNPWINLGILFLLAILSFVPIKYLYPSRLDYLTHSRMLRAATFFATVIWGISTAGLLWIYPHSNLILDMLSMGYLVLYVSVSLYRTWVPLNREKLMLAEEVI